MFTVYNKGSVSFRSTEDNLYQLKNLNAPEKSNLNPEDDTLFQNYLNKDKQQPLKKQEAVNTYKKMANLDTSEEVYLIEDIMTKNIIYINNNAILKDAYELLKDKKVSHIPIVSFGKKIVGMIDKKIILGYLIENLDNPKDILEKKLENLLLPELITAYPIADIRSVCKVMLYFKLGAIPIVNEDNIIVGIVSKTDIIKAISHLPKLQLWS